MSSNSPDFAVRSQANAFSLRESRFRDYFIIFIFLLFFLSLSLSTSSFSDSLDVWSILTYLKQKRTINKINHVPAKTQYAESRNKEYIFMDTACVVYHQRYTIFFACVSYDPQVHSSVIYENKHEIFLENNNWFVLAAYVHQLFKHFENTNLTIPSRKIIVSTSKRHQYVTNLLVLYFMIFTFIHLMLSTFIGNSVFSLLFPLLLKLFFILPNTVFIIDSYDFLYYLFIIEFLIPAMASPERTWEGRGKWYSR
jgi:hypothetical protein